MTKPGEPLEYPREAAVLTYHGNSPEEVIKRQRREKEGSVGKKRRESEYGADQRRKVRGVSDLASAPELVSQLVRKEAASWSVESDRRGEIKGDQT